MRPVMLRIPKKYTRAIILLNLLFTVVSGYAADVHVAVATNFVEPLRQLQAHFEHTGKHHLIISMGSTAQLYAQIKNGAPFEIFLAADVKRPELLVKEQLANHFFIYAVGRLVLWSQQLYFTDESILTTGKFNHLALANPRLAPYGTAAQQVLEELGVWELLQDKIVVGTDVGQAFQFVATGNAELGFIALSQYKTITSENKGSQWLVPPNLHAPIRQAAVLLTQGEKNVSAHVFIEFLKTSPAIKIIESFGYATEYF